MAIKPNKHSNPDQTIIAVAALLLKTLSKSEVEKYDDLEELVDAKIEGGGEVFIPSRAKSALFAWCCRLSQEV